MLQGSPDAFRPLTDARRCPRCDAVRQAVENDRQVFTVAGACLLCEAWLDEIDRQLLEQGCTRGGYG